MVGPDRGQTGEYRRQAGRVIALIKRKRSKLKGKRCGRVDQRIRRSTGKKETDSASQALKPGWMMQKKEGSVDSGTRKRGPSGGGGVTEARHLSATCWGSVTGRGRLIQRGPMGIRDAGKKRRGKKKDVRRERKRGEGRGKLKRQTL